MKNSMDSLRFAILRIAEDWAKNEQVSRHLKILRKIRNADPEVLEANQNDLLQRLLEHAYATVPFYRRRFQSLGIRPRDIRSLEEFQMFPPLERRHIADNVENLISENYKIRRLIRGSSSGSTGNPVIFYKDRKAYSAGRAAVLTGWELSGTSLGAKMTTIWGNQKTVENDWSTFGSRAKAMLSGNCRIPAYQLTDNRHIINALEMMERQNDGYLYGYTNSIYALAKYIENNGIGFHKRFRGVLTTAESLLSHQRSAIEKNFGPVFDGYGCGEILGIAFQCNRKSGYHIIEPNVIVEKGRTFGNSSELIITDLWNYAMPLIRYRIGDLFSGSFGHCDCGCTWKTFDTIDGRTSDLISTPNGGYLLIPSIFGSSMLEEFPFINQYQLVKISQNTLELRIEPKESMSVPDLSFLKDRMMPYLHGSAMDFTVTCLKKIEIGANGKRKLMIDKSDND